MDFLGESEGFIALKARAGTPFIEAAKTACQLAALLPKVSILLIFNKIWLEVNQSSTPTDLLIEYQRARET